MRPFDTPKWSDPKVHRDFHCEVAKAIYSVHHHLVGRTLRARRDSTTVKLYLKGELVKVHPRKPPGGRSTDPADMPTGNEIYATRDIERLGRMAAEHGDAIGRYAAAILDTPLPWTKMRQVYRLLGLVKKWGADRVEEACRRALDAEAVDVNLVSRMLERAREYAEPEVAPGQPVVIQGRFARDPSEFSTHHRGRAMSAPDPDRLARAQGPHAQAQARPAPRHPARAPGPGQEPRPRPHRVLGAALQRRGDPPRRRTRPGGGPERPVSTRTWCSRPGTTTPRSPTTAPCGPS